MKHLFYVHSHITFLVSKQYILDKGINPDDCLLLCSRNYVPRYEYQQIIKNIKKYPQEVWDSRKEDLSLLKNLFNGFHGLKVLEDFITAYCQQDEFFFYTFSTNSHMCSIMVTMKNCRGYYLIEEGASSYSDDAFIKKTVGKRNLIFQSLLVHLFPRFYLLKNHHYSTASKKFKGVITTSEKALFQLKGEHIIISNPFGKQKLSYSPSIVLSVDASLHLCQMNLEHIETIMNEICKFVSYKYKNPIIAYKMHPMIVKEPSAISIRNVLLKAFENFRVEELPNDIAIEDVLNEYHCDFFSDWSSVAIYANQMGCKCYSYAHELSRVSGNVMYMTMEKNAIMNKMLKEAYIQL